MSPRVLHLRASTGLYGAERAILVLCGQDPQTSVVACLEDGRMPRGPQLALVEEARARGLRALSIPCRGALDPLLVPRILRAVRREKVDVVHSHGYKSTLYGLPAARLARRGFVVTLHGSTGVSPSVRAYERLEMELLRASDGAAAVSPVLLEQAHRHAPRARIVYLPNGLDVERTRASGEGAPPAPGCYFAVVGRLSREKGLDVLLEAVSLLRDRLRASGARVVVLGDGPLHEDLVGRAASLGVAGLFELRGYDPAPARWMRGSIGVLLPSRTEGLPYTALEAMALERPLVATRVGALPELVKDGVTGLLIEPGDARPLAHAMGRLLDDPDLGARLGRAALEEVRDRWSGEAMARRYREDLYEPATRRR